MGIGFPSEFVDAESAGAKYLISFAVGATLVFPLTAMAHCLCRDGDGDGAEDGAVNWHFGSCFAPGFASGVIWNAGNLASLYAIESLGYSVAYPVMQSSLIVGSALGVFVWKEISDSKVIAFVFAGGLTVLIGCAMIAYGVDA